MTSDVNVVISHSEYTVLVVDDVVSNVLLLKVLLTNEKFKVITAGNGKEALSQAVNARPDLILLDVMMPETIESRSGNTTYSYYISDSFECHRRYSEGFQGRCE